jgi:uncharacterized protein
VHRHAAIWWSNDVGVTMSDRPGAPPPATPPGASPPPPPAADPVVHQAAAHLDPTGAGDREPILDVLRGFALLGILLVNIEFMRGSAIYGALLGLVPDASASPADQVTSFAVGWLVSGKFVSAFSIMFGIGAALIARRALDAGRSPNSLLARRYGWLIGFGLAHMLLLFPGDVLFVYGITGMVLLAFVRKSPRTLLQWSAGLLLATALLYTLITAVTVAPTTVDGGGEAFTQMADAQQQRAAEVYAEGSYGQIIGVNAFLSLMIQSGQLFLLPWFLALFLFGFAIGRTGLVNQLRDRRPQLRRAAVIGLGVGLPLNLVMGLVGPLGTGTTATPAWVQIVGAFVQLAGAPVLTVGYLSALVLFCLRRGPIRPLAAAGRMALSAYLLQSLLALIVFWGFGFYDRLGATQALAVVVGIWGVVLVTSMVWMHHFRFGPAEWLWRSLTYGRLQPLRASVDR